MKRRVIIIALMIAVLSAFYPHPRASADPLTVMAIVGLAAVASFSSVDMATSNYDDNRDQRAQQETDEKIVAKSPKTAETSNSGEVEVVAQR